MCRGYNWGGTIFNGSCDNVIEKVFPCQVIYICNAVEKGLSDVWEWDTEYFAASALFEYSSFKCKIRVVAWLKVIQSLQSLLGSFRTWRQPCIFFCRHVQTVMLVVMQSISENMLPMPKICVAVTKCERALTYNYNYHCSVMVIALDSWSVSCEFKSYKNFDFLN